jgi:hypothetical protein
MIGLDRVEEAGARVEPGRHHRPGVSPTRMKPVGQPASGRDIAPPFDFRSRRLIHPIIMRTFR